MMALKKESSGIALCDLLHGLADCPLPDIEVTGINLDSRKIRQGDLFLACRGHDTNGSQYINNAIEAGTKAIAIESELEYDISSSKLSLIPVSKLRYKAGIIAARFYGQPSNNLDVVGITGTNGKTSISYILAEALTGIRNNKVGLIGTLGYGQFGRLRSGKNTTPDAVTLQQMLAEMRDADIQTVIMEVSSHALDQGRVAGTKFKIGVFTNLSVEHLDYHGDLDNYARAKKQLFLSKQLDYAVINADDVYGNKFIKEISKDINIVKFGLVKKFNTDEKTLDVKGIIRTDRIGILSLEVNSPWGEGQLNTQLTGDFNAYNLLASISVLGLLKIPFNQILQSLSSASCTPGRVETFSGNNTPIVIVDYAHTPDALEKVLISLKQKCKGKLVCVFGCGGDRDKSKRSQMGSIAESLADRIILTNDNPRMEDPASIIQDILAGIRRKDDVVIQHDRAQAIKDAINSAENEDIVIIAGKGHETYQEIAGRRYPFNDRQLVRNILGDGA